MKKIITLQLIIFSFISNTSASIDSLNFILDSKYCTEIIDTNLIQEDCSSILKVETNLKGKKLKSSEKTLAKPANWFEDAWDAFTDLFKPVWGYYEEDGQRSEGPYFLFDRTDDKLNPTSPTVRSLVC